MLNKNIFKLLLFTNLVLIWLVSEATAIYDPTFTGIKTKSYRRDPLIAQAFEQRQFEPQLTANFDQSNSHSYQLPNVDANVRLSAHDRSYNTDNNNNIYQRQPQQQQQQQQQYHHNQGKHKDHQQQLQAQPLYERNNYERHAAIVETSNWSDAENSITEYYAGCPTEFTGQLPYAYDCRRFLNCWKGRGHIQSCAPGTVFNPETLECDRPDKVVCGVNTALGNRLQQPASAQIGTYSQQQQTPINQRAGRLVAAKTESRSINLCPPGLTGLQPHPNDCTKFINCANGVPYVQACGPGTAYSITMMACDFLHKVNCGERTISQSQHDTSNRESKAYQSSVSTGNVLSDRQPYVPQNSYGAYEPSSTTATSRSGYSDRWSNMHMARPDASGYRPSPSRTQLPTWSDTRTNVQQQLPVPSITIEEGSLQPNRNYHKVYSTPLAPMSPRTLPDEFSTSTTTQKTNIYYAQPVLSQEDTSDDIYSHVRGTTAAHLSPILPVNLHASRTNHSRDYSPQPNTNAWKPIAQPPKFYPPHNSNAPDELDSHNPYAPTPRNPYTPSYNLPSPHLSPSLRSDSRQQPLPETVYRPVTKINIDNLPAAGQFDITNYDQLPSETQSVGSIALDDENLYGGLQPPFPAPPQSANAVSVTQRTRLQPVANINPNRPAATDYSNTPISNDQSNLYGGLQPPQPETTPLDYLQEPINSSTPRSNVRTFQIYPPIKNATTHGSPQYSDSYAGVAHSRNNTWSRKMPTVAIRSNAPQSEEDPTTTSTPRRGHLPPPYNREYYKPTSSMPPNALVAYDEDSQLPISEAIRALLRPYLSHDDTVDEIVAKNAESHIMNLLPRSSVDINADEKTDMTKMTTTTTIDASKLTTIRTTTTPPTTFKQPDIDTEDDVELILAGEQHSLVTLPEPTVVTKPEVENSFHLDQSKSNTELNNNWPSTRGYNKENHLKRSHMPNSFNAEEQNSLLPSSTTYNNKNTQAPAQFQHHHHHHHRHHHQLHHEPHHHPAPHHPPPHHHLAPHHRQHSHEFHLRHPHLSNPFPTETETGTDTETKTDIDEAANGRGNKPSEYDLPNPNAESTTPIIRQAFENIDPRSSFQSLSPTCDFDCGNAKCINSFEVCDGVNNCGNRKDESQCDHLGYQVRLAGGETANVGRVEVKILGKWGYVCDDKFGLRDADVVCKELGFQLGAMEVRGNSFYAPVETNPSFVMDEVDCRGNETTLKDCDFKGWGINNCGPDEVVGVACKVPQLKCPKNYWLCSTSKECIPPAFVCDNTPDCEDKSDESDQVCNSPIEYRLDGGRAANEGRLEVLYRGKWGSVCDDDFGVKEAQVACNSLGYYGKPKIEKNIFGPGSGPIWLDQVACFGNETTLDKCSHWTWGEHNCNHTEDVGLRCTAGPPPRKSTSSSVASKGSNDNSKENSEHDSHAILEDIGLYMGEVERSSKFMSNHQRRCGHFKDDLFDAYEHPENERVLNGTVAKRGRHPWQATIRLKGRGGISSHWCGAVLISKKHLLTAAHCLVGYQKGAYFVRMGDHYANIAESSEIDTFIENWYIHEKFRDKTHMNNDIAVIVLKNPVRFNDYIQPICLPDKGVSMKANRMCTISGWGSIKSGISTPSNILRAAQVPLLADDVCSQPHVYGGSMTDGMFCAGLMDESVDACDGDSGGPLVCSDEDGETLYGIISWGQHCGYPNKPGVYVRVEKYIDWIYEKINLSMQQAG